MYLFAYNAGITLIFFIFYLRVCVIFFKIFFFCFNARIATIQQRFLCKYNTKGQQQRQKLNIHNIMLENELIKYDL